MRIIYTENNTKICNSYLLTRDEIYDVALEIVKTRIARRLPRRGIISYIREIKAHNRLYKLHLFRSHTKHCDLEEPISKFKELIYTILSI